MGKLICMGMDESICSVEVLRFALLNFYQSGDTAQAIVVVKNPADESTVKSRVTGLLGALSQEADVKAKSPHLSLTVLVADHAGKALCDYVKEHKAALLVVGSHGKTVFQGMTVGSVSSYCLVNAPVPVVAARLTSVQVLREREAMNA